MLAPRGLRHLAVRLSAASAHPGLWWLLAYGLLAYAAAPLSDHPDSVRDLLQARDCAEGGHCIAGGAHASFGQLRSGAFWPATLAALRWLGLPTQAAHALVLAADASAIAMIAATAGALPAASLTCGLLLLTREQLVWSPALMPMAATMVALTWRRARHRQHPGAWAGLGLALALLLDLHPVGALYAAAALLVVPWTTDRPGRALALASATALGGAAVLAAEVQWANLQALHQRLPWLLPLASLVLASSAAAARTQRSRPRATPQDRRNPSWQTAWPALLAATLAALALGLAAALGQGALAPRYFLPALPAAALATAAIALPRGAAPIALLLAAVLAAALGPAPIGVGHPWPVVRALAGQLQRRGVQWPQHLYRIQGYGCRRLAAAVNVELAATPTAVTPADVVVWQLVDLQQAAEPRGPGWQLLATRRDGGVSLHTWGREATAWLHPWSGQACLRSDRGRACQPLRPGTIDGRLDGLGATALPWHLRTFPEAVNISPDQRPSQTEFELDLRIARPGKREIALAQLADRRCPWRISGTRDRPANLRALVSRDGQRIELLAQGPADTALVLSRSWGPGCDDPSEWEFGPPCLQELEVSP